MPLLEALPQPLSQHAITYFSAGKVFQAYLHMHCFKGYAAHVGIVHAYCRCRYQCGGEGEGEVPLPFMLLGLRHGVPATSRSRPFQLLYTVITVLTNALWYEFFFQTSAITNSAKTILSELRTRPRLSSLMSDHGDGNGNRRMRRRHATD